MRSCVDLPRSLAATCKAIVWVYFEEDSRPSSLLSNIVRNVVVQRGRHNHYRSSNHQSTILSVDAEKGSEDGFVSFFTSCIYFEEKGM